MNIYWNGCPTPSASLLHLAGEANVPYRCYAVLCSDTLALWVDDMDNGKWADEAAG
jgi:hypothetical protein